MKIITSYTRVASLWDFVSRLTLWHHSYRPGDRDAWIAETGELTSDEQKALKEVARISKHYNTHAVDENGQTWLLDRAFTTNTEKTAWRAVKALLSPTDYLQLTQAVQLFDVRFEKLWRVDEPKLAEHKQLLDEGFAGSNSHETAKILQTFFQPSRVPELVHVYLLPIPEPNSMQGGANLGFGEITLRCSRTEPMSYGRLAGPVWHEAAHLYQQDYCREYERKFIAQISMPATWPSNYTLHSVFREPTVSSLIWPFGYASEHLLDAPSKEHQNDLGKDFENLDPTKARSLGVWVRSHQDARDYCSVCKGAEAA